MGLFTFAPSQHQPSKAVSGGASAGTGQWVWFAYGLGALTVGLLVYWLFFRSSGSGTTTNKGGAQHKLMLYYSPTCGHCQRLEPVWKQLEAEFPGRVHKTDCSKQQCPPTVKGVPTIQRSDGRTYAMDGERTLEALSAFLLE